MIDSQPIDGEPTEVSSDETVLQDGTALGHVCWGGYAHPIGYWGPLGCVPTASATTDGGFEIEILGERFTARVQTTPLRDPDGERRRN